MNPKKLSDIEYHYHVTVGHGFPIQTIAEKLFKEWFPENTDPVTVRLLFTEDGYRVWESYQDAGSVDYIYIKELPFGVDYKPTKYE